MWGFELLVMLAMIAINSVFAGYEIALASIGVGRLRRLAEENHRGAKVALHMKQNMEASLAVVQLGITLAGAIAANGTRIRSWRVHTTRIAGPVRHGMRQGAVRYFRAVWILGK